MEFTETTANKINDCSDVFENMMRAYYLIYSALDAIETGWGEERLIEHVSFLIDEYHQKMIELVPTLRKALEDALESAKEESLLVQKTKLDEVWKTDTVG
jgi:hypothetical protein